MSHASEAAQKYSTLPDFMKSQITEQMFTVIYMMGVDRMLDLEITKLRDEVAALSDPASPETIARKGQEI